MKYPSIAVAPLIMLLQPHPSVYAATIAQPTTCISSQFSASGDQYWKNILLKLTNNCGQAIDFQNATVTFKSKKALNTSFWGDFAPLPYPDNNLNISSQAQADGTFLATLNLHFPSYQGSTTQLAAGKSIQLQYGVNVDNHIDNTGAVYLSGNVQTGSLVLSNSSSKPNNVAQNYALVHLTMNGQVINDIQVPWGSNVTLNNLAVGTYNLAPENVTDSSGINYQGNAVPNTFTLTSNATAKSTVSYTAIAQVGKIIIRLNAIPSQLAGYTAQPSVLLTKTPEGSSTAQVVGWDKATTVSNLSDKSSYTFSTPVISYGGYNCTPGFNPSTLIASASTAPTTTLSYNCVQVAQDSVHLNVSGAPASLQSLTIQLTPNDSSAVLSQTINLTNGSGSNTISLTDGVIYTLSAPAVPGYSVKFSPQPLTVSNGATATITLTQNTSGTPVAINGQLTVCGTQLCNQAGNPIQLKGMSTHGLQWYGQGTCITSGSLDALSKNFKANVIRLSLYVQEDGYESNPTKFTNQVSDLINEAYNRGMYVIVDWHILTPGDPNYNLARAKKFFTDIASIHKNKNNLLYEIANEPNGVNWASIKSYAEQIIPVIRAIDPKAPIIIGTRGWSSLGVSDGASYQEMVTNPVQATNIMYAFHFYAASHRDEYLNALNNAAKVLPIFVTEFGTQNYSGEGANDFVMSDKYMQLMADKKIGWTNWNYSDDFRSGAIWKTNTCSQGVWTDDHLKEAGVYIKNKIQAP